MPGRAPWRVENCLGTAAPANPAMVLSHLTEVMEQISDQQKLEICRELRDATKEYSADKNSREARRKRNPFETSNEGPSKAQARWDAAVKEANRLGVDCSQLSRP